MLYAAIISTLTKSSYHVTLSLLSLTFLFKPFHILPYGPLHYLTGVYLRINRTSLPCLRLLPPLLIRTISLQFNTCPFLLHSTLPQLMGQYVPRHNHPLYLLLAQVPLTCLHLTRLVPLILTQHYLLILSSPIILWPLALSMVFLNLVKYLTYKLSWIPHPPTLNPPPSLKPKNLRIGALPWVRNIMPSSIIQRGISFLSILHKTSSGVSGSLELSGTQMALLPDIRHAWSPKGFINDLELISLRRLVLLLNPL